MAYELRVAGELCEVVPIYRPGGFDLSIAGRRVRAALLPGEGCGEAVLEIDGARLPLAIARHGDVVWVQLGGRAFAVELVDSLRRAARDAAPRGGAEALLAPMPGVVVLIAVAAGDLVAEGDLLVAIESMKLQTAIRAPHAARVVEIAFARGASFEKGAVLVRLAGALPAEGAR